MTNEPVNLLCMFELKVGDQTVLLSEGEAKELYGKLRSVFAAPVPIPIQTKFYPDKVQDEVWEGFGKLEGTIKRTTPWLY